MAKPRFVKVCVLENRFAADLIRRALDEAQIPFIIKEHLDTAYDGLYLPQKGWASLMVAEGFEERALSLVSELEESCRKR